MDDRSRFLGFAVLGLVAVGSLLIMGLCAATDRDIPPSVSAAFGTAVGALAGILAPKGGGSS